MGKFSVYSMNVFFSTLLPECAGLRTCSKTLLTLFHFITFNALSVLSADKSVTSSFNIDPLKLGFRHGVRQLKVIMNCISLFSFVFDDI